MPTRFNEYCGIKAEPDSLDILECSPATLPGYQGIHLSCQDSAKVSKCDQSGFRNPYSMVFRGFEGLAMMADFTSFGGFCVFHFRSYSTAFLAATFSTCCGPLSLASATSVPP